MLNELGEIGAGLIFVAIALIVRICTTKEKLHELEQAEIEQSLKDGSIETRR